MTIQAYLSMGIIQQNNDQLVRGVERAKTTTVTALRTAVIVAQSLENQKLVLDQIDAVNKTTDAMIDRTSKLLQENSLRTQQQAVSSGVSPETLRRAYDAVFSTLDSIDKFREQANESFSKTIDVLNDQLQRAHAYAERMNRDGEGGRDGIVGGTAPRYAQTSSTPARSRSGARLVAHAGVRNHADVLLAQRKRDGPAAAELLALREHHHALGVLGHVAHGLGAHLVAVGEAVRAEKPSVPAKSWST